MSFLRNIRVVLALSVLVSLLAGCAGTQISRATARERGDVWFVLADRGVRLDQDEFFELKPDGTLALHPPPDDFEIEGTWKRTGNRIECEVRYVRAVELHVKSWQTEAVYLGEMDGEEIIGVGKNRFGRTFTWRMVRGTRVPAE